MLHGIFTIYDQKAFAFLPPFFAPNRQVAMRIVEGVLLDQAHAFNRFSEDYTLFELGEFDEQSGEILSHEKPQPIAPLAMIKSGAISKAERAIAAKHDINLEGN